MPNPRRLSHETSDSRPAFKTPRLRNQLRWRVSGSCGKSMVPAASTKTIRGAPICHFGAAALPRPVLFSRLYCTERALWKLHWFLRDFGYDADLLNRDQVDEKALLSLRGVVRTSHKTFNGRSYQNLDSFAPAGEWEVLSCASIDDVDAKNGQGGSDGL